MAGFCLLKRWSSGQTGEGQHGNAAEESGHAGGRKPQSTTRGTCASHCCYAVAWR